MINSPKKIHIIGPVGSGKTYLAKLLSTELSIPHFQLDNFVWRNVEGYQNVRNPIEVRDNLLNEAISKDSWIIEGAQDKWVANSFAAADVIIYLCPNVMKRYLNIIRRFIKEKIGLEKGNYSQNINDIIQLFKWNHTHNREAKPRILQMVEPFRDKVIILKDNRELLSHLNNWKTDNFTG